MHFKKIVSIFLPILSNELVHVQGVMDETITEIIALSIIAKIANEGDKLYEKALYWRLLDQVYFAPIFIVLYNEPLPQDNMDLTLQYFSALGNVGQYTDSYDQRQGAYYKDIWPKNESVI